jgi:pentatricopeptide repeat protein
VRTYEYFLRQRTALDAVAFTCAARAAGFCRPFTYTLQLLENAYHQLGARCVSVAATAIINRKYMPKSATTVNEVVRVLDWLGEKKCALSSNVLVSWQSNQWCSVLFLKTCLCVECVLVTSQDSALAVVVAHGTDADCADILQRMRGARIMPTIYSYNALLDRAARQGDEAQALSVVAQMQAGNVSADSTTYNTLLKLYVIQNNADSAVKVHMLLAYNFQHCFTVTVSSPWVGRW